MTTILRDTSLTCPSCVRKIETTLKAIDGVHDATVHFTTGRIVIVHDPQIRREALIHALRTAGYEPKVVSFS